MDRILEVIGTVNSYLSKAKERNEKFFLKEMLHTYGVGYLSAAIALSRGLNAELAFIIGVLHDIGKADGVSDSNHSFAGAQIARNLLTSLGSFTNNEVEIICNAIYNHPNKKIMGPDYDEVIKDADIIEKLFTDKEKYKDKRKKRKRLKNTLREFELKLRKNEV